MAAQGQATTAGWGKVVTAIAGLAGLLLVLLIAFALPAVHAGPHEVPVAVAGPAPEVQSLRARLERAQPGAFTVTVVADAARARELILDRTVYGAVVLGGTPQVLTAGAASPAISQLLTSVGSGIGAVSTDIRPLPAADPKGAGLAAGAFPLALGGWIGAVVLLLLVRGAWQRAVGALGFAVVGALTLIAVLQFGIGTLDGNYLLNCAAGALGVSAACWAILGLRTALGNLGLGIGAAALILLGNPLSGLASAPELLPAGWGTLGQFLPPGAFGSLLRSTAYFDGAGALRPALVLACWFAAGIALFVFGAARAHRREMSTVDTEPAHRLPVSTMD
jgi:hypothetical protein